MSGTIQRDEVDGIVEAWVRERPDIHPEPLAIFSRLLRLDRHVKKIRRQIFARFGLEPWEFEMLTALRRQGAPYRLTAGRLMQETLVSSGTVTNRIDRMVARGNARRLAHESDKRVVLVEATLEGLAVVDEAMAALLEVQREHLSHFDDDAAGQLAAYLRELLSSFEATAR